MKPKTTKMAGFGVLFLFLAGAAAVMAEHVSPDKIDHEPGFNPTCMDFAPEGADWNELKIEEENGTLNGTYSDDDGNLTVVIVSDGKTSFNWTSDLPVFMVFVKDGKHGHHLYNYTEGAMADTMLTAAPHKDKNTTIDNISHVSFCYGEEEDEEPPNGGADECPPGSLSATANSDSSITVSVSNLTANATLMRSDGGAFEEVASFNATSDTYFDTDTEVGVTYTYQLVIDGDVCDQIEVTAIPVFPGLIGAVLATGLGVLGYVGLRRRS